jgi:hypothetical protein
MRRRNKSYKTNTADLLHGLSFQGATCAEFYGFFYSALSAYKKSLYSSPDQFWEMQNRRQLSRSFTLAGETLLNETLSTLAGEHVALVFDACTLHHRHEIAGLFVTPQLGRDSLLVYLVEASNEQSSYAEAGRYCEMLVRFFVVTKVSILNFYFLGSINLLIIDLEQMVCCHKFLD